MQWFRMYGEFATDPVVQSLSFDDQRHFVIVLCLKCAGALDREFGSDHAKDAMLRRALGLESLAFLEARNRLCESGLINDEWQPKNWAKRQFQSDHSAADRMRRYRERNRDVTVTQRVTKSDVLDSESDTDTEAEKNKKRAVPALVLHESLPKDAWAEWIKHRRTRRWSVSDATLGRQLKLLSGFTSEVQRQMIDTSIQAGWQGLFAPKGKGAQKPATAWKPPEHDPEYC